MYKNGVVIVTYNRKELLKECIEAVNNQTYPFAKIIVVNNCSTDGTKDYLAKQQKKISSLTVINEEENLGGAGGFYDAMKTAQDESLDYLLIIDDDAILRPDYMEKIIDFSEKEPGYGKDAYAGTVYVDKKIDPSHRRRIGSKLFFTEKNVPEEEYKKDYFKCDLATFCGLVVRGDVFRKKGLPRKDFFIWYDDSDYSLRLNGIYVVPGAGLDHKTKLPPEGTALLERTTWRHYYGYRNRYVTGKTYFGNKTAFMISVEYHLFLFISRLMLLSKCKRKHAEFNLQMISDALEDGKRGELGVNRKYLPAARQ